MSKVWDKPITADTDWGGDASTDNLPVSGRQVQAWIKGNIKSDDAISLLIAKWLNEHTTKSITFWKGLPIDSGTLKWVDEHLTVVGGTGGSETPQDLPFIYDPVKKAWEFKGDFVVTGAITMFGSLSGFQPSTVTEAVEVDGETIVKTKNSLGQWQLTAIGRGGGTGGGISAAEVNILISNALEPYALSTSIPTDNKQLSNGAGYATVSDLDTRINNLINGAPAAYDTLKEIADVLAGNVNSIGDILTALDTKATKTYVDAELEKYVKLATAQSIEAQHNFVNGLQIGSLPITKSASANNTIYLDANLVVSGAITMFGSGSTTFPTIWANIPFNLEHMSWDGSQWNVIVEGGSGSGSLDTNAVNALIYDYLTQNNYATIRDISSALGGYATQSWVGDNYLAKSGGTITTDSIAGFSIYRNNGEYSAVHFYNTQDGNKIDVGYLGAAADGRPVYINSGGGVMDLIHSGNYSGYALPITGGTVNGNLSLSSTNAARSIRFDTSVGSSWLFVNSGEWYVTNIGWGAEYKLVHSGNIGSYNAGSATQLQTARTIWGQSFDGTSDITGDATLGGRIYVSGDFFIMHSSTGRQLDLHPTFTILGGGNLTNGNPTYIDGHNVYIRYANDTAVSSFLSNGNVAVGGTTADAKLHVHGNILTTGDIEGGIFGLRNSSPDNPLLRLTVGNQNYYVQATSDGIYLGPTSTLSLKVDANGNTTINGNLLTTGVITMFSQASLKNEVDRFGLTLEQLSMIEPVRFTWKDNRDSLVHAGGIADEVMRVLPEVVHRTKDDKLTMDYGSAGFFIAASLIKPVIDHEQRLQSAEKEIIDLKAENKRLREQLRIA